MRLITHLVPLSMRPAAKRFEAELRGFIARATGGLGRVSSRYPFRVVGSEKAHTFFGYFDITPFSPDGSKLLAHQVAVGNAPERDAAQICVVDTASMDIRPFSQTDLWCWQMGARLRWLGQETVVFNKSHAGSYGAAIVCTGSGRVEDVIPHPLYDIAPDGNQALSLNFSRLQRLRPGYGYARVADATSHKKCPEADGLQVIDLRTKTADLVYSTAEIAKLDPHHSMQDAEHYLNHLSYSPSGNRITFFHLWITQKGHRFVRLVWCEKGFSKSQVVPAHEHISHMAWVSDDLLLAFARMPGDKTPTYQLINLATATWTPVLDGQITQDGHPAMKPHSDHMFASDTYPDRNAYRHLYIADLQSGQKQSIGKFFSPPRLTGDMRCDLHPRWSHKGDIVALDSAHLGYRVITLVDLSGL